MGTVCQLTLCRPRAFSTVGSLRSWTYSKLGNAGCNRAVNYLFTVIYHIKVNRLISYGIMFLCVWRLPFLVRLPSRAGARKKPNADPITITSRNRIENARGRQHEQIPYARQNVFFMIMCVVLCENPNPRWHAPARPGAPRHKSRECSA